MMYLLWNNKKKINQIMNKLKFYESFDVYTDNTEFFPIWDIAYMRTLCTAKPYFSILNKLKPQPYLILELLTI